MGYPRWYKVIGNAEDGDDMSVSHPFLFECPATRPMEPMKNTAWETAHLLVFFIMW